MLIAKDDPEKNLWGWNPLPKYSSEPLGSPLRKKNPLPEPNNHRGWFDANHSRKNRAITPR
jgi:hypothetical protein